MALYYANEIEVRICKRGLLACCTNSDIKSHKVPSSHNDDDLKEICKTKTFLRETKLVLYRGISRTF